jgi:hypothetical protein
MLDKQSEFNINPDARAPVPEQWALKIGQSLTRVPAINAKNANDVRVAVAAQYLALKKYFGDYADDVILYALSRYKGLSKSNAELIKGYMQAIQQGGDPLKLNRNQQTDMDQVEGASNPGLFSRIGRGLVYPFGLPEELWRYGTERYNAFHGSGNAATEKAIRAQQEQDQ